MKCHSIVIHSTDNAGIIYVVRPRSAGGRIFAAGRIDPWKVCRKPTSSAAL